MSTFKVFIKKNNKTVAARGKFDEFPKFSDLKKKIFTNIQNPSYHNLKDINLFKLVFTDEKDNSYIPEELSEGIYDEETFTFFKNKIKSNGVSDGKYRLYIEKVDSLPKFKKKENYEILDENLKKYWDSTLNDITSELTLMKLEESKNNFDSLKEIQKENEKKINKIKHDNIICSNCFKKDFLGKRFICSECNNYNLCQECEKLLQEKEIHQREHVLIQINKNMKDDISKYNNVIGNYRKEFQNVDEVFSLDFIVVNNGENDLQNCCILPIRYGDDFLSCDPKIITNSVKRGTNLKISLDVKIPQKTGYFEGYFRMFTPSGLPFGNIIYTKVLNGN